MPILAAVAVAGAATAATMAVAGVALATAVTYVGVGMSVVGAVTKNKNFMKVGGVMGLAGGVMSAVGVGTEVAGAAAAKGAETAIEAQAFDAAMAEQGAAEFAVTQADPYLAATGTGAAAPAAGAAEVASSTMTSPVSMPPAPESMAPVPQTPQTGGLLNATKTAATAQPEMSINTGFEQAGKMATPDPSMFSANMPNVTPPPPSGISGWWASQSQPQKDMWMKAAASGVGSMFQGWSEEQKLALQREIANQNQGNIDTRQNNLNAQPIVSFRPVGGYPQSTGLLGSRIAKVGG